MMIMQIVAIRDMKANVWSQPQFVPSIGSYLRQLGDEVNSPRENNVLHNHPEDFESWHLGHYNDETGQIELLPQRKQLCALSSLVVAKQ